jgi:hypothetical protein
MGPTKFRKKPVEIEAMQFKGGWGYNGREICKWVGDSGGKIRWTTYSDGIGILIIETLEGTMTAIPGNYIIKGVNGEFYPCKPDIFDKTYELVE